MKPVVKYGAIAAAAAAVLLAVAAAVLYSVVDTEFIKREAARAVKEQTGRDLVFQGDVGISVFPWLGVKLGPLSLSNAPGFGDAPMAEIRSTEVKVKLLPLFSGTVEVGSVLVDGLALNLGRDTTGRTNFDDIVERAGAAGKDQAPAAKQEGGDAGDAGGGLPISGLSVGGVAVSGASLVWDDRMRDKRYAVSDLNVTTGALALGQPFDLALSARAEASDPAVKASVDLKTRADLGADFKTPSLGGLRLTLGAEGGPVPGGPVEAVITGDVVVNLNDSTVTVSGLTMSAYDLTAKGGVKVSKFDTAPVVDATLDLAGFDPRKLMARLGLTPPATTDPAALTRAAVSFKARASQDSASLADLSLTLDDTRLSGKAAVKNFARPAITFDLAADALDADRYLPPGGDGETAKAEPAPAPSPKDGGAAKDEHAGLPKEDLKKLDVDGTLRVGKLTLYKVRLSDMQVTVKAKDGVIRITPLAAGLYGGLFKTSLLADVSGKATRTKVDLGLADLGLGGLLTDLMGEDKVTGTAALDLSLAAVGDEWKSMVRTLTGKGSIGLKNGAFKGFQVIPQAVRAQAAAADPEKRIEKVEKQQTFKDISATFAVAKGLLTTGDTSLSADNLSALGKGAVNLVDQTIDYKAVVDITAVPKIPFNVTGPLADPSVSLDSAEFAKGLVKSVINAPSTIGKGLLDGGKGTLEGIGSGLKNLFGGGRKSEEKQ